MKKFVSLLLAICLLALPLAGCGKAPDGASETSSEEASTLPESPVEDFEYAENEDGGITITKYIGEDADVVIPGKIDGKDVTKIGESAFYFQMDIFSVWIPDTVTAIESAAFRTCIHMTSCRLPSDLLEIGARAFKECGLLEEILLPDSLCALGEEAFQDCASLKQITVPASITEWGVGAFSCTGIEEITFAAGISRIGPYTFAATKIRQIDLPGTLSEIPTCAFAGCENLESVTFGEGIVSLGAGIFASDIYFNNKTYDSIKLTEIVIPASVKNVNEGAFVNCGNLKKLKFEGDAPQDFSIPPSPYTDFYGEVHISEPQGDFTICYHEGAEGFTSPTWEGYNTEIW